MLIKCTNRGCLQDSDAKLDSGSNEVICGNCGKAIDNISSYMKTTLKQTGQIVRAPKTAFSMPCATCKTTREVILNKSGETVCKSCGNAMKVTTHMKQALKTIKSNE